MVEYITIARTAARRWTEVRPMLIVDMPSPVKEWNCLDCKAICVDMLRHYCGITKKTIDTLKNMRARPDWCPIKGVLPDEHGDLIDTSTVVGSIKRETDIHDVTLKEYLGFKFPVQTIVPIDEFLENRKTIPIIIAAERKDDE